MSLRDLEARVVFPGRVGPLRHIPLHVLPCGSRTSNRQVQAPRRAPDGPSISDCRRATWCVGRREEREKKAVAGAVSDGFGNRPCASMQRVRRSDGSGGAYAAGVSAGLLAWCGAANLVGQPSKNSGLGGTAISIGGCLCPPQWYPAPGSRSCWLSDYCKAPGTVAVSGSTTPWKISTP